MTVFLNGEFVPEEKALVSVFDRGFLYGDGLFEAVRIYGGAPFLWDEHMERLQNGADALGIRVPFSSAELKLHAAALAESNQMPEGLLRLTLSRGRGLRGYSPRGANQPTLAMTLHSPPAIDRRNPPRWMLITSSIRLPADDALAIHKTCNKLRQVLARAEADAVGADEALLLNTAGAVVEATSSNLFWIERETVCTAPLPSGILAGTTRHFVLGLAARLGLRAEEKSILPDALLQSQSVFLTGCGIEIIEAAQLDGHALARSPLPGLLQAEYAKETARHRTP